jgi:hypothetical protein
MQGAQGLTLVVDSKSGGTDWKTLIFVRLTHLSDTLFWTWDYHDGIR